MFLQGFRRFHPILSFTRLDLHSRNLGARWGHVYTITYFRAPIFNFVCEFNKMEKQNGAN